MIALKIDRIKSSILFSLVIISFVLTTQIWFSISIEGLFVMPSKETVSYQQMDAGEKKKLLKPDRLVVHVGENHTLLFNNEKYKTYYKDILDNSYDTLWNLLENGENFRKNSLGMDKLEEIRGDFSVELIFNTYTELNYIKSLLNTQKNLWSDIKQVRSIIISPHDRKIYVVDPRSEAIHEFAAVSVSNKLESAITELSRKEDVAIFLSDFNEEDIQFYGRYAVAPVSIVSMPVLTIEKEIKTDTNPSKEIADVFNDRVNGFMDSDGTVIFTDREDETASIDDYGVFEYYKYNVSSKEAKAIDVKAAIDIAANYVNQHFKFNGDFYLSSVESSSQGGRTSYTVRFDYKYNGIPVVTDIALSKSGIPVVTDTALSKSAIEVEIVGDEVKRYKRNVRSVISIDKNVSIKTFNEVLDFVQGWLDSYLIMNKSETIMKINDLYLAYYEDETNSTLIPVWVADVNVESTEDEEKDTVNKKYIIRAEDNFILGERLGER